MRFANHCFRSALLLFVLVRGAASGEGIAKDSTDDVNSTPEKPAKPKFDADLGG